MLQRGDGDGKLSHGGKGTGLAYSYFLLSEDLCRDGIFKPLRSPGFDSKESIPPAYVAWRAGRTTLFVLGS
jgi:hypothetical protein